MNCGVLDRTWPKMLERLKITDRNYMLTNNQEFGFILVFLYSCWMIKGNKNLEFQKKVTQFRKTSKTIMEELINDIKPYLKESNKIYKKEFVNIKNFLKHCLHRKVSSKNKESMSL